MQSLPVGVDCACLLNNIDVHMPYNNNPLHNRRGRRVSLRCQRSSSYGFEPQPSSFFQLVEWSSQFKVQGLTWVLKLKQNIYFFIIHLLCLKYVYHLFKFSMRSVSDSLYYCMIYTIKLKVKNIIIRINTKKYEQLNNSK